MSSRFRRTDLFALAGLLALLVWTPPYLAADETTRMLATGESFTLPPPRIGDEVVFEMIVRNGDADPEVVGPIGMMTRRAVEPGEVPRDAVWVEEWTYFSGEWDLSVGSLITWSGQRSVYYDAAGLPIWYHGPSSTGGQEGMHPAVRGSATNDDQGRYAFQDLGASFTATAAAFGIGKAEERSLATAVTHRGETYVGDPYPLMNLIDRFFDIGDSHLTPRGVDAIVLPWMFQNQGNLRFEAPPQHDHVEEWKWFHTDQAAAVGYHWGYGKKGQDTHLDIDILPRTVTPGDGDALPITMRPTRWDMGNALPRDPLPVNDVPFIDVATMGADPRPVLGGFNLPTIRALLGDQPGWRDAWAHGAHIVGFDARLETTANATAPAMEWALLLLDADDKATIGRFHLAGETISDATILCSDVVADAASCSTGYGFNERLVCNDVQNMTRTCPRDRSDPLTLTRQVPDPWALWARSSIPAATQTRVGFTVEPNMPAGLGVRDRHLFAAPLGGPDRGPVDPHRGHTFVADENDAFEAWNLADGHVDRQRLPTTDATLPVAASVATNDDILTPLPVVPAALASGGLLLVGISALVRAWGTFRLFALTGFAVLYARITDDEVLAHGRRDEIMRILRAEPGLTATEVSTRLGLPWGVTAHHLERLRRAQLVVTRKDGRKNHFFPVDVPHPELLLGRQNPDYDAFLRAVLERPGVALRDLEAPLGRGRSALSRTGSRLVRLGLVKKRRDGMVVRFYPQVGPE